MGPGRQEPEVGGDQLVQVLDPLLAFLLVLVMGAQAGQFDAELHFFPGRDRTGGELAAFDALRAPSSTSPYAPLLADIVTVRPRDAGTLELTAARPMPQLPAITVVTNIDREHLDHYADLAEVRQAFVYFANRVPFYGVSVLCADDERLCALFPNIVKRYHTYGLHEREGVAPDFKATDISGVDYGKSFRLTDHTGKERTLADFGALCSP